MSLPSIGQKFDFILAFSMFTHYGESGMIDMVGQLQALLKPTGTLAFTFFDPHYDPAPGWSNSTSLKHTLLQAQAKRTTSTIEVDALLEKARYASRVTLINDQDVYIDDEEPSTDEIGD